MWDTGHMKRLHCAPHRSTHLTCSLVIPRPIPRSWGVGGNTAIHFGHLATGDDAMLLSFNARRTCEARRTDTIEMRKQVSSLCQN